MSSSIAEQMLNNVQSKNYMYNDVFAMYIEY